VRAWNKFDHLSRPFVPGQLLILILDLFYFSDLPFRGSLEFVGSST